MRTESTELEHREIRELINQSQNWFFENAKTRQKDKTVANLSKVKKQSKVKKPKLGNNNNLPKPHRSGYNPP